MDQVRGVLGQIGRQRLIMMAVVAAVMLAVMAIVATRGGDGRMAFLFTDLDPAAAQSIADKLKAQNIAFQLSADGTAVLAPEDKLAELRMSMAGDKLGGKIGYDVLDQEEPFGVSASRAKMNETRVIEGELARSIQTLQSVASARVHIVMPERDLFATQASKATAAVTVRTKGRLSPEAVQSIRYLVSSSVPELSPSAVSIIDQTGALLARAGDDNTSGTGDGDDRQRELEGRMRDEIEALLAPIVGQGKVRANVSADIDRDQTREESDTFDPDKQVIAHQITVGSKDQSSDTQPGSAGASVANQLPEAQAQSGSASGGPTRTQARDETSEDTTYDNTKTHSTVLRGPGKIKRLTVAVMVDGGAKGLPTPMIQRLTKLVENAVGADSARGDSVVIDSMAFAADATLKDDPPGLLSKLPIDGLINFAKLLAIAIVGLVALRMIRPKSDDAGPATHAGETLLSAQAQGAGQVQDGQGQIATDGQPLAIGTSNATPDREAGRGQVDGNVKVKILHDVGDTIAANPSEAVAVIREWMNT